MSNDQAFLNRKEISSLTGLSRDSIRRNEKRLGLLHAKQIVNCRHIRYYKLKALASLEANGFLP